MKNRSRNGLWILIVGAVALVSAVALVRQMPDKVTVDGKVFYVKLYAFTPPLHIGQGAPPLPVKWKPWLDSADKLNRVLEREVADYIDISLMATPPSPEELEGWKREFREGNSTVVAACQESVYYFVIISMEGSDNRFLVVGNLPGFPVRPLTKGERVGYTCFVEQDHTWKNTNSVHHPELNVIEEALPVNVLSELQDFARPR
jgi:hypothetical protein